MKEGIRPQGHFRFSVACLSASDIYVYFESIQFGNYVKQRLCILTPFETGMKNVLPNNLKVVLNGFKTYKVKHRLAKHNPSL